MADEPERPGAPAPTSRLGAEVGRSVSWMALAQLLSQLSWIGSLVVLSILLPPGAYGTVSAGMVLVGVATLVMGSGTYGSIVVSHDVGAFPLRRAVVWNVAVGVVLCAGVSLLAGPLTGAFARGGDPGVLRGLSSSLLAYSLSIAPAALLQKQMRFRRYAVVLIAATTFASVCAVVAGFAGAGVWALVLRQVLYQAALAAFAWWALRGDLPRRAAERAPEERSRVRGNWFFVLALADFVAFNADYLIVGHLTDARRLGLYSLAFTVAFVPLRQFAWQIGGVFFSVSAAGRDAARAGRQMLKAMRVSAVLLLPLVPPAIALAPVVIPSLLGNRWADMVVPFQILIAVGVGHALLNVIGEFLSGIGGVAFRARTSIAWGTGMIGALIAFVEWDGIRGAAVAHVALFVPLAVRYVVGGGRLLHVSPDEVARAVRSPFLAVTGQAVMTAAAVAGLRASGADHDLSLVLASVAGLLFVAPVLWYARESPLQEALDVVRSASRRERA